MSRTDPRIAASRARIRAAAVAELAASGYGRFTIEAVAARAGVGKSTVYRHWPDRVALILDALGADHARLAPPSRAEAPRAAVTDLAVHVAAILADPTISACVRALVEGAAHDERLRGALHAFTADRRAELSAVIAGAAAAGQARADLDPDTAADLVLGPLFHRRLLTGRPVDAAEATRIVDAVLGPACDTAPVLHPVGRVASPLTDRRDAPRQGDRGAPDAWLDLDPRLAPALEGVGPGGELVVLTWLHLAGRDVLVREARDGRPRKGVFATRSPARPNPIGLHRVRVLAVEGTRVHVTPLEAVDGTPVLDLKPVLRPRSDG